MSDLDNYVSMLSKAKIDFKQSAIESGVHRGYTKLDGSPLAEETPPGCTEVVVYGGYNGFYSVHTFDTRGNLVKVESYE